MKILLINAFESTGGAAKAAYRLFKSLSNQKKVDVKYLVSIKSSRNPKILCPWPFFSRQTAALIYFLDSFLTRFYPNRTNMTFSTSFIPTNLSSYINALKPDVVHFHWITHGFMSIEDYKEIKSPIVWTLHDSWAFTGGCHLPFDCIKYQKGCGACPQLGSLRFADLSHQIWRRKMKIYPKLKIAVISPSRWLAECAENSSLFKNQKVRIIPNGVNLEIFSPKNMAEERKKLRFPAHKKLILISAAGIEKDANKGLHLIDELFEKLRLLGLADLEFLILGTKQINKNLDHLFPLHYLGTLREEEKIASLYQVANLTLLLSRQENLPFSVMESLACGTPVVAFKIGGIPDMIEHKLNGYLAQPFSLEDIAAGIKWCLDDDLYPQLSFNARKKIVENFSLEKQTDSYISLYQELIDSFPYNSKTA